MATLKQNVETIKRRYKDRTGVDAIIKITKDGKVHLELFPIWCSSPGCVTPEEQNRLLNFLVTVLDLYLEEDENAFQFIDALLPLMPSLETAIEGISWIHGYLSGVAGADISKLKLDLFDEEETEYEDEE